MELLNFQGDPEVRLSFTASFTVCQKSCSGLLNSESIAGALGEPQENRLHPLFLIDGFVEAKGLPLCISCLRQSASA